jgi:hypothetical protein
MYILGIILWRLVLLIGLPMGLVAVLLALHRSQEERVNGFENPDFREMPFERFPLYVRMLLGGKRNIAKKLGFTELVSFTRKGIAQPNFCCIMVSPDRGVYVEIEYIRLSFLVSLLCVFVQPMDFLRSLLGFHGMTFCTAFHGGLRVITSPLSYLGKMHEPGSREMNIVSGVPEDLQYSSHKERIGVVIATRGLTPRLFHDREEFFSMESDILAKLARQMGETMEVSA